MTFSELLAAIREPYIAVLADAVSAGGAFVEPAYRLADGALATEGALSLPCRADVIRGAGTAEGQPVMVDSRSRLEFEPVSFEIEGTTVLMSPFVWDWAPVEVCGLEEEVAAQVLKEWFLRWFDQEDTNGTLPGGLHGVVHFMSDPKADGEGIRVVVDLGSSPGQALEDLLFCLSDAHARQVRVGQTS